MCVKVCRQVSSPVPFYRVSSASPLSPSPSLPLSSPSFPSPSILHSSALLFTTILPLHFFPASFIQSFTHLFPHSIRSSLSITPRRPSNDVRRLHSATNSVFPCMHLLPPVRPLLGPLYTSPVRSVPSVLPPRRQGRGSVLVCCYRWLKSCEIYTSHKTNGNGGPQPAPPPPLPPPPQPRVTLSAAGRIEALGWTGCVCLCVCVWAG